MHTNCSRIGNSVVLLALQIRLRYAFLARVCSLSSWQLLAERQLLAKLRVRMQLFPRIKTVRVRPKLGEADPELLGTFSFYFWNCRTRTVLQPRASRVGITAYRMMTRHGTALRGPLGRCVDDSDSGSMKDCVLKPGKHMSKYVSKCIAQDARSISCTTPGPGTA